MEVHSESKLSGRCRKLVWEMFL